MTKNKKKYNFIYKTTNLKNGKFYIGMHSTDNLSDGYLGSGCKLRRAIRRNGVNNFKLEILEFLPDRNTLKKREEELVNEDLLKDPMCMNLKPGGEGGFNNPLHRKKFLEAAKKTQITGLKKAREVQKILRQENPEWWSTICKKISSEHKLSAFKYSTFKGKQHSQETKHKISLANSINHKGELNSQFGTRWITDGIKSKKIKFNENIPVGWKAGRIILINKLIKSKL